MSNASTVATPPQEVVAAPPVPQRILIVEDLEDTRASYQQLLQLALVIADRTL